MIEKKCDTNEIKLNNDYNQTALFTIMLLSDNYFNSASATHADIHSSLP